jgi:hypothetical protein
MLHLDDDRLVSPESSVIAVANAVSPASTAKESERLLSDNKWFDIYHLDPRIQGDSVHKWPRNDPDLHALS